MIITAKYPYMKYIGFAFALMLCTMASYELRAQAPPPPPPPAVYKLPPDSAIRPYLNRDFGVSVEFAGNPIASVLRSEFGVERSFVANFKGSNETLTVIEFGAAFRAANDDTEVMRLLIERILVEKNAKLVRKANIHYNGVSGTQLLISWSTRIERARIFIRKHQMLILSADMVNGHIFKDPEGGPRKAFDRESIRYFESLKFVGVGDKGQRATIKGDRLPRIAVDQTYNSSTNLFSSKSGAFEVRFPARPVKRVRKVNGANGKQDFVNYISTQGNELYSVAYLDSPSIIRDENVRQALYERQVNLLVNAARARDADIQKLTDEGGGLQATFSTAAGTFVVRFVFRNQLQFHSLPV